MTGSININKGKEYECEECKLVYKRRELAEKCEAWCKENKSCNLEITRHAVKRGKGGENG